MSQTMPRLVVYLSLFLVPLLTLPFTQNYLDFQKQFFLLGLMGIGLFFWIWNALNVKKLVINANPLHFFAAAFLAIILVSSIFSLYSYGSLWGVPLPVAESFAMILSFSFLYFLISNNFKKEDFHELIAVLAISGSIASIFGIIQSFGLYLLPFLDYTKSPSFNTVGTASGLALFAAIILAVIFPLVLANKTPYRKLLAVCGAILFLTVIFFNGAITALLPSKPSGVVYNLLLVPWIVLAVSALATFLFSVSDQKFLSRNSRAKNTSFAVLAIAFLFLTFNIFAKNVVAGAYGKIVQATGMKFAIELSLDQQSSADVAVSTLKQSAQNFFLGSGPGTFVYDYVKFKPAQINQDGDFTFLAAASEILNRVATTGLLGVIALLLIFVFWTIKGFRMLTEDEEDTELELAIFSGWLAIAVAMFFYQFNVSLMMLFWVFMGLIIAMDEKRVQTLHLRTVKMTYAVSLIFVAVLVLELGLLVWGAKRYYAEIQYRQAILALQRKDLPEAINRLQIAAESTNKLQDNYLTGLSQIYFQRAQEELSKQEVNRENALVAIKIAIDNAVLSTKNANPNNSANWAVRGYLYRQLIGSSEGFDTEALNMYQKALDLEPNNPVLWTEIGQVYILKKDYAKAKESFTKAAILRPQYIDPHYYLALISDQEGDKQGAIGQLEAVYMLLPVDDKASRENVIKAIDMLKEGKSLSGSQETAGGERTQAQPESIAPVQDGLVPSMTGETAQPEAGNNAVPPVFSPAEDTTQP